MKNTQILRLILGDQLNPQHSWYRQQNDDVVYLIAELHQEANYVKHHVQKLCGFFAAMKSFAEQLKAAGHRVEYLTLDDTEKYKDLIDLIVSLCLENDIQQFEYQQPDE